MTRARPERFRVGRGRGARAAAGFALLAALLGCGGGASATITVAGQVTSLLGSPAPGVVVRIQGRFTQTDADGGFSLAGVTLPSDVLLGQAGAEPWLPLIEGVDEVAPNFGARFFDLGDLVGTTVALTLADGPVAPGRRVRICAEGVGSACTVAAT